MKKKQALSFTSFSKKGVDKVMQCLALEKGCVRNPIIRGPFRVESPCVRIGFLPQTKKKEKKEKKCTLGLLGGESSTLIPTLLCKAPTLLLHRVREKAGMTSTRPSPYSHTVFHSSSLLPHFALQQGQTLQPVKEFWPDH